MKFGLQVTLCVFIIASAICGNDGRLVNETTLREDELSIEILLSLYNNFQQLRDIDVNRAQAYETKSTKATTPQVSTTSGRVTGSVGESSYRFYEIPFAEPPIGSLRYKAPKAINTPMANFDASTKKGIYCEQVHTPCVGFSCIQYSEDCLFLNVFVPKNVDLSNPNALKPVMIFVHGGAFFMGSASTPAYDGTWLAGVTDTVVVTMNYRLGPFGFLEFNDGSDHISGNLGLDDQRLAMQWVHDNIENFGGNPNSVTLFGESAGAQSVLFHLVSEQSDPLFHRAIMQSNPAVFPYPTPQEAQVVADKMTDYLGCGRNEYDCLMQASAFNLMSAGVASVQYDALFTEHDVFNLIEPFRPVVDGSEFTDQPLELFKQGKWQRNKKLIIGTNSQEVDPLYEINPTSLPVMTESMYRSLNNFAYGTDIGPSVSDYYIGLYGNKRYGETFSKSMSHSFFVCPSRALANFAKGSGTVYLYDNAHPRQAGTCESGAVGGVVCGFSYHASELVFVFQSGEEACDYTYQSGDYKVQDQFANYWGNMAYYGDPSHTDNYGSTAGDWPTYSSIKNQYILIENPSASIQTNYNDNICDFWDSLNYYVDQ